MNWILGGFDGFMNALIAFVVMDYFTGFMAAFFQKTLSIAKEFKEIYKKIAIFCLVGVSHIIDVQLIGNSNVLRNAVVLFYLSGEGFSIIENIAVIGVPIPKGLIEILKKLRNKADENR